MITDKDVYRSAQVLIEQFGDEGTALLEAMARVERYRQKGNKNGMRVWNRIADAIEFFSNSEEVCGRVAH